MYKFNKRGEVATAIVVLIIIIVILVFFGWVMQIGMRECNSDADCGTDQYCTYSHACKDTPVIEKIKYIEKPVYGTQVNYNAALIFLGIAIVVAAVIIRWEALFGKKKHNKKEKQKSEYVDLSQRPYKSEAEGMYDEYLDYKEW